MALYAQRRDSAGAIVNHARQLNHIRTSRPLRGSTPTPCFQWYGAVNLELAFLPVKVRIDPVGDGDLPEHKAIVAVDAFQFHDVDTVWNWQSSGTPGIPAAGYFFEGHVISGGDGNRVVFDGQGGRPEPFIIENGDYEGQWIRPEIQEEPPFTVIGITLAFEVRSIPV